MRPTTLLSLLLAMPALLAGGLSHAQTPAAQPDRPSPGHVEQRTEHIRHEDAGSRIDELRVGGETRSITVKPKGDAPAYDITPESSNRNPASTDRDRNSSGSGGWKIKSF